MKMSKGILFVLLSLVFVVAGAVLLLPISSDRGPVKVYEDDVEPVREDRHAGIASELVQAMRNVNLARDSKGRTMANEELMTLIKEINSDLDADKDSIRQEIQGKSFDVRFSYFDEGMDAYSLQERAEIAFTLEDLPQLRAMLGEPERANRWWKTIMAVAILEPDKDKAYKTLDEFFERPEDWVALHHRYPNRADTIARNKFCAVIGFGYINSDKSNEFLLQLMKKESARELVTKSGDAVHGLVEKSECIELVQGSAAHGIMVTRNEKLIPYLIDASIQAEAEFQKDHGFDSARLSSALNSNLALHYYYKDHGWEGGHRLRVIMNEPLYPNIAVEPVRTCYEEYLFQYYIVPKVYKLQYERGLVTKANSFYLEKYNLID